MKFITLEALKIFKNNVENEVENKFKSMFDLIRPIGVTYTQYPQQASPNELWGEFSTWEVIDYDGAFFRAEGGNANPFIEESGVLSKQADQNKAHLHIASGMNQNSEGSFMIHDGADIGSVSGFVKERIGWTNYRGDSDQLSYAGVRMDISHTHTIEPDGGNETRPQNYTVRIWKRTA